MSLDASISTPIRDAQKALSLAARIVATAPPTPSARLDALQKMADHLQQYVRGGWLNPATAPLIPVPSIGTDPNGGTTIGVLPVWLHADDQHEIDRITAPDIVHNTYFGWGVHMRVYSYPSDDEQWSAVAGIKERVERGVALQYQRGRARRDRWSFTATLITDRDGTPRFYGIGNHTQQSAETNYTRMYPVTMNHAREAGVAAEVARDIAGADRVNEKFIPMMGAEDFSFMLEARPGAMILVGMGDGNECHHPAYVFNDNILGHGASYWVRLIEKSMPAG